MKRTRYVVIFLTMGWLGFDSAAWAQGETPPQNSQLRTPKYAMDDEVLLKILTRKLADSEQAQSDKRLAEDMEILATIVRDNMDMLLVNANRYESMAEQYFAGSGYYHHPNVNATAGQCGEPLVEYIPGTGIVLQIRIPAPRIKVTQDESTESQNKKLTQWEITRQHLRGEGNQFAPSQCEKCHDAASASTAAWQLFLGARFADQTHRSPDRPTISAILSTVLEILSENGHQVRDLKPQERITISLCYSTSDAIPPQQQSNSEETKPESSKKPDSQPSVPEEENKTEPERKEATGQRSAATDQSVVYKWFGFEDQPPSEIDRMTIRRIYLDALGRPPTADEIKDGAERIGQESVDLLVQRLAKSQDGTEASNEWMHDAIRFIPRKSTFPSRSRISVSATKEQLDKVASGELSTLDLMRLAQIRLYDAK